METPRSILKSNYSGTRIKPRRSGHARRRRVSFSESDEVFLIPSRRRLREIEARRRRLKRLLTMRQRRISARPSHTSSAHRRHRQHRQATGSRHVRDDNRRHRERRQDTGRLHLSDDNRRSARENEHDEDADADDNRETQRTGRRQRVNRLGEVRRRYRRYQSRRRREETERRPAERDTNRRANNDYHPDHVQPGTSRQVPSDDDRTRVGSNRGHQTIKSPPARATRARRSRKRPSGTSRK